MSEWLGVWEPHWYFGKHEKKYPADDATGYRYNPNIYGNDMMLRDWNRVYRAIPVYGTVEPISWSQSPQAKLWLDKPKKSLWRRFLDWFHQ